MPNHLASRWQMSRPGFSNMNYGLSTGQQLNYSCVALHSGAVARLD